MVLVTCSGFPGRGTIIGGAMAPLAPPLSTSLHGMSVLAISKCRFTLYKELLMARSSNFSQYYFHVIFPSNLGVNKISDFIA